MIIHCMSECLDGKLLIGGKLLLTGGILIIRAYVTIPPTAMPPRGPTYNDTGHLGSHKKQQIRGM